MEQKTNHDPFRLTSEIKSIDDVKAFTDEQLSSQLAAHEMEIVKLTGVIDSMFGVQNLIKPCRKFMQAQRILRMHKGWIAKEIADRLAAKKQASRAAHQLLAKEAKKAKAERIKLSNEDTLRQVAVFKSVALEVMGREMYEHIWEMTHQRIAREAA